MKVTWGLLSKNLEKYVYEPRTTRNKRLEPNMASGLSCSLLGLCCVCQAAFEDPFEEDRCLCVFVGLIFPVVACQLCFAGASGWRGGTILGKGCRVTRVLHVSILGRRLLKTSLSRKRTGSCALIALVVSSFPIGQVPRLFRHTTRSRKRPGPCD